MSIKQNSAHRLGRQVRQVPRGVNLLHLQVPVLNPLVDPKEPRLDVLGPLSHSQTICQAPRGGAVTQHQSLHVVAEVLVDGLQHQRNRTSIDHR
eukprot:9078103-Pyramimonas_sp.AAC.1